MNGAVTAIALVHQSGLKLPVAERARVRTRDLWRVKNWRDHPRDPGWDDGLYCACHAQFRNAQARRPGEIVVDCVNDGSGKGYVVRSYFTIAGTTACHDRRGQDPRFRQYHFCDEQPFRLDLQIGPAGRRLTGRQLGALLAHPGYRRYAVSRRQGPRSIASQDWRRMVQAKARRQRCRSRCGS